MSRIPASLLALSTLLFVGTAHADDVCGSSSVTLYAGQTIDVGTLTVSNDENSLTVTYTLTGGWQLTEAHVHVGCSLDDIPSTRSGNPKVGNFDYKAELTDGATTYSFDVPYDAIECFTTCGDSLLVAAHAAVQLVDSSGTAIQGETAWGAGTDSPGHNWATYTPYTTTCCAPPPPTACEQERTQTQGGWGTSCHGDNPGCYRDTNFDACIGGLIVGDTHTITLSTSDAVEAFLPQGGTAAALTMDHYDPTTTEAGVLGGQVSALALSVAFDTCDASFGASSVPLANAVVVDASSPCNGWTVQQVLDEGNAVLGGGGTLSASDINSCLTLVNENYVDGTSDKGDVCAAP